MKSPMKMASTRRSDGRGGTLLIPMTYSDFTYVGNGWVVAVTLEETTDEKSDYRAMFGGGHYNVVLGDIYYGAQKMAEMNREETTGASMEVYGAYLFVRLDKSSGFYLKTDGTQHGNSPASPSPAANMRKSTSKACIITRRRSSRSSRNAR